MRYLKLLLAVAVFQVAMGQDPIAEPIDSRVLLYAYDSLTAEENHKEAIKKLDLIQYGDSNYTDALLKKSICLNDLERYDEALKVCDEGLSYTNTYWPQFLLNKGFTYSNQEKTDAAIRIYKEVKQKYPAYSTAYTNLAYQFILKKEYDSAYAEYKRMAELFPFKASTHIELGKMAFHQGHITEAFLALNMALLLEPGTQRGLNLLSYLNDLSTDTKKDIQPKKGFDLESKVFKDIDDLVNNYIALNDKYKVKTKSPLFLAKQNHLILNQLLELDEDDYFYYRYYAPFYKSLMEEGWFEAMQVYQLIPSKAASHQMLVNKSINDLKSFNSWLTDKWAELNRQIQFPINGKMQDFKAWHKRQSGDIEAIGQLDQNDKLTDSAYYFFYNGILQSKGLFKNGSKEGYWTYYYENGNPKTKARFKDDVAHDTVYLYHDNGVLKSKILYSEDGQRDGPYIEFYDHGVPYVSGAYKDGKFEGPHIYNFSNGSKEYDLSYFDNKVNGSVKEYYVTGELYREDYFTDGLSDGKYLTYWINGKPKEIGAKSNGEFVGAYKSFWENGNLYQEGHYNKGELDGVWKEYDVDGNLYKTSNFSNGKEEGITSYYDYEGNKYLEYELKNGFIISFKHLDAEGNIIKEGGDKKKKFTLEHYNRLGVLISTNEYKPGVGKDGKFTSFGEYGEKYSEGEYIDNKIEGELIAYFPWGDEKRRALFKDGELDGYWYENHINGKMYKQGHHKVGSSDGIWKFYYLNGKLENERFFQNGKYNGYNIDYDPDGKLVNRDVYKDGRIEQSVYYDTSESVLISNQLPNGNGQIRRKSYDGSKLFEGNYVNGKANGKFIWHYPSKQVSLKGQYINDNKEAIWESYHENGKVHYKGEYKYGGKTGEWKYYDEDGALYDEEHYEYDMKVGQFKSFSSLGHLTNITTYKNDRRYGPNHFFSDKGEYQMSRYYIDEILIAYAYLDENKDTVRVPIKNGSAKIEARFPNGNLARTYEIKHGIFTGKYKTYYANGQINIDYELVNDERHGAYRIYYENGQLHVEANYYYGLYDGLRKEYHPNGQLKSMSNYKLGERHGLTEKYDAEGNQLYSRNYYHGVRL